MGDIVEIEHISDPRLGIYLYKNMLDKDSNIVERIEKLMSENDNNNPFFKWSEALVGFSESRKDYRDCVDFKVQDSDVIYARGKYRDFREIYKTTKETIYKCLNHYEEQYGLKMDYMEAINFVKYGAGQHFEVHSDHGYSYTCTVSSIMYLNDGYEGGELWFPDLNIKHKPKYGDVLIFPSTYIYRHASLPVTSGIKYSAVTMFDYNDHNHRGLQHRPEGVIEEVLLNQ